MTHNSFSLTKSVRGLEDLRLHISSLVKLWWTHKLNYPQYVSPTPPFSLNALTYPTYHNNSHLLHCHSTGQQVKTILISLLFFSFSSSLMAWWRTPRWRLYLQNPTRPIDFSSFSTQLVCFGANPPMETLSSITLLFLGLLRGMSSFLLECFLILKPSSSLFFFMGLGF